MRAERDGKGEKFSEKVPAAFAERTAEKAIAEYEKQCAEYASMSRKELEFEFFSVKTELEHRKEISFLPFVVLLFSMLIGVWAGFLAFLKEVLVLATDIGNKEFPETIISFGIYVAALISILIFWIFATEKACLKRLRKQLMMIEAVRDEREKENRKED